MALTDWQEWEKSKFMFKPGDRITISGLNAMMPNPYRRWWQFWKPRMIDSGKVQQFHVTDGLQGRMTKDMAGTTVILSDGRVVSYGTEPIYPRR